MVFSHLKSIMFNEYLIEDLIVKMMIQLLSALPAFRQEVTSFQGKLFNKTTENITMATT